VNTIFLFNRVDSWRGLLPLPFDVLDHVDPPAACGIGWDIPTPLLATLIVDETLS